MNTNLLAFTSRAMRFWKGKFDPIAESTRRTADTIEDINTGRVTATAIVTSVSDSATSVTLLAANADRIGGSFFNDSTSVATIKAGTTASASSLTHKMLAAEYWEIPYGHTGRYDCIWASAAGGAMRITEYTA